MLRGNAAQPQTLRQDLYETISELQNRGGRQSYEKQSLAADWIKDRFRENGVEVRLETYEYESEVWKNVVAEIKGTREPEKYIVVMAHLDTVCTDSVDCSPGADDNGSGTAMLLELAKMLHGAPLKKSVLFCIFSNEEPGAIGSSNFAKEARKSGLQIEKAINFDVLGYNPSSFAWDTLKSQKSYNKRIKAFWTACKNYWTSLFNEKRAIRVAGRPANAELVKTVSSSFSQHTGLQLKALVKEDCG